MPNQTDDRSETKTNPYAAPHAPTELHKSQHRWQRSAMRWAITNTLLGGIVGAISRYVRPMIDGPIHYEAIVSTILMLLLCAVVAIQFAVVKPFRWRRITVVSALIFAAWLAYSIGWSIVHGSIWDDTIGAMLAGCLVSLVGSLAIFGIVALIAALGKRARKADA